MARNIELASLAVGLGLCQDGPIGIDTLEKLDARWPLASLEAQNRGSLPVPNTARKTHPSKRLESSRPRNGNKRTQIVVWQNGWHAHQAHVLVQHPARRKPRQVGRRCHRESRRGQLGEQVLDRGPGPLPIPNKYDVGRSKGSLVRLDPERPGLGPHERDHGLVSPTKRAVLAWRDVLGSLEQDLGKRNRGWRRQGREGPEHVVIKGKLVPMSIRQHLHVTLFAVQTKGKRRDAIGETGHQGEGKGKRGKLLAITNVRSARRLRPILQFRDDNLADPRAQLRVRPGLA